MHVRKVGAFAGLVWWLDAFKLLWHEPAALLRMGFQIGLFLLLPSMVALIHPALWWPGQIAGFLLLPVLMAALVSALFLIDRGQKPGASGVFIGFRQRRLKHVVATALPWLVWLALAMMLFFMLVGAEQLQVIEQVMQEARQNPAASPKLEGRINMQGVSNWMICVFFLGVFAWYCSFTALCHVMLADVPAFRAMWYSLKGCAYNFPAMMVYGAFLFVVLSIGSLFVLQLSVLIGMVLGPLLMVISANVLLTMLFLPLYTATVYSAWKQLFVPPVSQESSDQTDLTDRGELRA